MSMRLIWLILALGWFFLEVKLCKSEAEYDEYDENETVKQEWCHEENCYEILGLEQSVDHRAIKSRYNNLSLIYHPDKNPNQTQAERDKYVKINRAYEILSDSKLRIDYDQYLRIRTSMDSPKEHPIFVLGLLYAASVVIVLQYQKQHYRNVRKSVLDNTLVQQYFEKYYNIDLKGNKKLNKRDQNNKSKSKNKNKNNKDDIISSSTLSSTLLASVDPTINKNNYDEITDEQINEVIKKLPLEVPDWNIHKPQPDWTDAFWAIPHWLEIVFKFLLFQLRWQYHYSILKKELSESDREYLCRTHFRLSEAQWDRFDENQKQSYLVKSGKWKKKTTTKSQNTKKTL